jgi:hypothetical protein
LNANDVPAKPLVVGKILRHFSQHPDAKDTSEGILQWWLAPGDAPRGTEEVEEILDYLVTIGWLIETKIGSSPKLYGVNEERLEDIRAFLQEASPPV